MIESGSSGDIAVDDVTVMDGNCSAIVKQGEQNRFLEYKTTELGKCNVTKEFPFMRKKLFGTIGNIVVSSRRFNEHFFISR